MLVTVKNRSQVGRYWREIFVLAWGDTELLSRSRILTTLGISVIAFGLQWVIGVRAFYVTVQIIGTVIVAYLCVALAGFVGKLLVTPAIRHRRICRENENLAEQLQPKLKMFFDKTDPNCVDLNYVPAGQHVVSRYRVFRVGIKNVGGCGLNRVEVKADYEWNGNSFRAIPLHQMHDESWLLHGTYLDPDEPQYVDVVRMKESAQDAKFSPKLAEIELCHIKRRSVRPEIGRDRHRIPIVAYANATPPERRTFVAWVDEWDRLQFEEETDQAASSQNVGSMPSS